MITAVVGAQYGSEGKGKVIENLAHENDVFVRVGGPNAGHVIYYQGDRRIMRSVPCGWINPNAKLVIGAGAVISIPVLMNEIETLREYDPEIDKRIYVDKNATVITEEDVMAEQKLAETIGSTTQGVGSARKRRIDRNTKLAKDYAELKPYLADTVHLLWLWRHLNILLEGTQGTHLSITHGDYPFTTSHDATVNQLCADVGIASRNVDRIIIPIRTFPIRVGGNSGPLSRESSFENLEHRAGGKVETTSVTKKVRRIGYLDWEKLHRTKILNAPTHLAVMFTDYYNPESTNVETWGKLPQDVKRLVVSLEKFFEAPAMFISTGVHTMIKSKGFKKS